MRILYLGNNWLGWQVLKWLKKQGEEIMGLVVHPPDRRKYGKDIIKTAKLNSSCIFDGSLLHTRETFERIKTLQPEIGISVLFGYILRQEFLDIMPAGCLNLHPSLLPYNRGVFPNVWSIVEGTPAGATIHYMDVGIDTGDIVSQMQIEIEPIETGESLYHKLEDACLELFKKTWPLIRRGRAPRISQSPQAGSYHHIKDIKKLDRIDLDRKYTARKLIDIIRARTFSPYAGAYFQTKGRKIYLRLQLLREEDIGKERDERDN